MFNITATTILVLAGACITAAASDQDIDDRSAVVLLSIVLLAYIAVQILCLRARHPERWMANPVVLTSVLTFALGYGVSNLIFLASVGEYHSFGLVPEAQSATTKVMCLALLASVAMWVGYWSTSSAWVAGGSFVTHVRARLLPDATELRPCVIPVLLVLSTAARVVLIWMGAYGYNTSFDRLLEVAETAQYLVVIADLGRLALALAVLRHYRAGGTHRPAYVVFFLLLWEIGWGFLSGFKSNVMMPFVVVGFSKYLATGTLGRRWIAGTAIGLVAAYIVIEPFRATRIREGDDRDTEIVALVQAVIDSASAGASDDKDRGPLLFTVAHRLNLAYPGSLGVEYADSNLVTEQDPAFLRDVLAAPAYAWTPRLIWPSKPTAIMGRWYHEVVMERPPGSFAAMGPVTHLFLAGGATAIVVGFLLLGVAHRVLFSLLQPWSSLPGAVVFLGCVSVATVGERNFDGVVLLLCRQIPLLILLQWVICAPKSTSGHATEASDSSSLKCLQ